MTQQPNGTPKAKLTGLTIMYLAMVTVMCAFGGITFYLNYSGQNVNEEDVGFAQILRYVLIVMIPAGTAAGYFIYNRQVGAIDSKNTLGEKLNKLQAAVLIRAACVEMPGLFGAVAAMITSDNSFLLFTAAMVVLFLFWRPTAEKVAEDLQLSMQERSELGG